MDLTIEGKAYVDGTFKKCCIGIDDGRISAIKKILKGNRHINFGNNLILPAGIDIHVHFRDPGITYKEDFYSGSLSAAYGGVSCVFDMPNNIPPTIDSKSLSKKIKIADKNSFIDFGIYCCVTNKNINKLKELAKYCSGFKIFLGESTNSLNLENSKLREAFREINSINKPVLVHAEDNKCLLQHGFAEKTLKDHLLARPSVCEEKSIKNILKSTEDISPNIHICHLSSSNGLDLLRNRPKNISCGVTPHHLLFSLEKNMKPETWYKVNPPIRLKDDKERLFEGIRNGCINILESDHAPHTIEDKCLEFSEAPSGIPGVETMVPLFLFLAKKGKISFSRLISIMCEEPANLICPGKGKIEFGRDADFIIVDLKKECKINSEKLHYKCEWTPFNELKAIFPTHLFVRGESIIKDCELIEIQGFGKFVGG